LAEESTKPFSIEVPLKSDRVAAEARRREFLVRVIYGMGGALILALIGFIAFRGVQP